MTLTIELTDEEEEALRVAAAAAGLQREEYARRRLVGDLADLPLPKTGFELVDYLRRSGVFGLFADRGDAQEYARRLRETAELRGYGMLAHSPISADDADREGREDRELEPMTPAQALEYWRREGLVGSYGDPTIDSQEPARRLRATVWGSHDPEDEEENPDAA